MERSQNKKTSSGTSCAKINSTQLLSLNDESIQRIMTEDLHVNNFFSIIQIGQKLKECAEAMLKEKFRDYFVKIDATYEDFRINEENVKKFHPYIRNIKIMGIGHHNAKKIATFVESNFRNLKSIELRFCSITHHTKNIFKNVDCIIFHQCHLANDPFCYHDDCLRFCERLRRLSFFHYGISEDDEDKLNAILSQTYPALETVHFDVKFNPNILRNWERFIQRNISIKSLKLRFQNEAEKLVWSAVKPVVDYVPNLQRFFLQIDLDARYTTSFNFKTIHEQLAALDSREHCKYLGIDLGSYSYLKIENFDLCVSLNSLKSLVINHTDPCNILPEISKYSSNVKILSLNSCITTCRLGDHRKLEITWIHQFPHLEELNFWKVTNAYFLIPLFIRRSPILKRIYARDCKIVLTDKNVAMSMKKFNDERRKVCSDGEPLIIYSDQSGIQSNYEFDAVKLKHIDFVDVEFNEHNPFECFVEDKIGLSVLHSNADEIREMNKNFELQEMMMKMNMLPSIVFEN